MKPDGAGSVAGASAGRVDRFVLLAAPGDIHPAFRAEAVENALADLDDGRGGLGSPMTPEQDRAMKERR